MRDRKKQDGILSDREKMDGLIIRAPKAAAREQLLEFLSVSPHDYSDLSFTPEEMDKLRVHMTHLATGATAAIPINCKPAVCPFAFNCPLHAMGKAPSGRPCIVESQLLQEWRRKYILEYEIDPDSMTELTLVNELAETELLLWRINEQLAKPENAGLTQEDTVGIDRNGNVHTKKVISALIETKERLLARRARVIKLMVGDRQEKYKKEAALKIRSTTDPSSSSADLRRQLQKLVIQAKEQAAKKLPSSSGETEEPETPEDLIAQLEDLDIPKEK